MPTPGPISWREPEHDELADLVRTFFAKEVLPHAERVQAQGHPDREHYRRAGELGLLGLSVSERYGGGGGDFTHEAVMLHEQARSGDNSLGLAVHSGIVTGYLEAYGNEEQKRRWLPGLCTGELIGAIAMTEPDGGSDLQAMRTRAVRDGDDYVVTGAKTFISNGGLADIVILAAKTDPSQGAAGVSLLVCETGGDERPGFRRGRLISKIGLHGNDTAELFFDGLRVPAANLLGDAEGLGFIQLMNQLPQERLVIGVGAVAAMERAVELTVAYTKERTAFGKPLIGHQNTRMVLAECATRARASRVFLDDCISRHVRGELDVATAAMAKYWLTDGQCEVIDRCLQLFGGYGYTTEFPIAQMYTDARAQKIYGGTNEIMKELIARAL
ncbi:acyl-CoA dehydrogenase family protein [Amorphoplanes digitatis]|uniref:Acyl-[acyl-carrier-protein] dehydrogenase MbtN n=1 Tax=Actinoplanes digitatis TaxID=1868 RepID=A0A7W7MPG1_9ACTN|nr:acyl-CoA dehydrogenase family protein [Actinoplanes digitatis]MBB4762096.1 acyl-CoA dehydrogenase [Actinoplanes digitatis]BFE70845.1 acyl-CoA dehydrogenase family protein [Actinoplanes digitatis]GID97067.1 acyl-CoA dehydrogenase [Actinoplanes digitatis]